MILGNLIDANSKGYCRVLLDQGTIEYMGEYLKHVDVINRCYLWRILFDQVMLKRMTPLQYI